MSERPITVRAICVPTRARQSLAPVACARPGEQLLKSEPRKRARSAPHDRPPHTKRRALSIGQEVDGDAEALPGRRRRRTRRRRRPAEGEPEEQQRQQALHAEITAYAAPRFHTPLPSRLLPQVTVTKP